MKKSLFTIICLIFAVAVFIPIQSQAATKKAAPKIAIDTYIATISPTKMTVQEPKKKKVYKITPYTEVLYAGVLAKVSDLKAGMLVQVSYGADATVADQIEVNGDMVVKKKK